MVSIEHTSTTARPFRGRDVLVLLIVGLTPLACSYFELLPKALWEHHPFHAVVEGLGSFAALIVAAAMIMLRRQDELAPAYVWVICGLIGMGMLDGFHAATHAGHVFVWLHSTATFVGGVCFALVWLPKRINRKLDALTVALLTLFVATLFGTVSIAFPDLLPAMKDESGFTFTAKALNVGGGIGFLAATAYFLSQQSKLVSTLIFANLSLLFGVAGILFEQSKLWDGNWWLWHLLRLIAYGVVLYFFMAVYYRTLIRLHQTHVALKTRVADVSTHEVELRQAHGKLEAILNSTADAIISIDEVGTVETFNKQAETLFGHSREEVIGNNVSMLMELPYRQEHDGYLQSYVRTGVAHILNQERELEARRKDGSVFPILLRVTEMQHADNRRFIGIVQDISERKKIEDERVKINNAIRETVTQLSTASAEISASMAQQSKGSESQSATVSDTTAVVEDVAKTAKAATLLASDVADTARRADEVGKSGRRAIEDTRLAMNTVRERAESTAESMLTLAERAQAIAEIITAVNEIADQTNLLALNAAIEASRAGEAGKGFAVVAAEVKSLAKQAKKATAQVRDILSEIQAATSKAVLSTEQGTQSVHEANAVVMKAEQTIDELGTMIAAAADVAASIVSSSKQQAASMSQVTGSMNEINQSAKQTFAATRQVEGTAHDLDALGNRLRQLIAGNGQLGDNPSSGKSPSQ